MNQTIFVRIREVYGVTKLYPACPTSERLARLAGHVTLTPSDIHTINELGYVVKEHPTAGRLAGLSA